MKALVYHGPGVKALEDRPKPEIRASSDAIVKMVKTTICGTDLHILKGDVPTCTPGRILGHEGVGIVDSVGAGVTAFKSGDHVLISCISSCGKCEYCRRGMYSHCTTGGWILGNEIDGTQAEYVRIPHADTSLYPIPDGADEEALVMLRDDQVATIAKRLGVAQQDVVEMNRRLGGDASLNTPLREEGDGEWQDWLVDESASQETILADREESDARLDALKKALRVLNARERRIFEARRLAEDPITLAELAEEFGVSGERVRQIDVSSFEKVQKAAKNRVAAMEIPAPLPAH